MPYRFAITLRYSALGCLWALLCSGVSAQQTETQSMPEIDTYVQLADHYRLMVMASRTEDADTINSSEFGPNLDIFFRPLKKRPLRTNDVSNSKFSTLR